MQYHSGNKAHYSGPRSIPHGINDRSTREVNLPIAQQNSFTPIIYTFAAQGGTEPIGVTGDQGRIYFGEETFNVRGKFNTHQTKLANIVSEAGALAQVKRVIPKDAPPPATVRLYVEYVEETLPIYKRNEEGMFTRDANGQREELGPTVQGYRVEFRTEGPVELGNGVINSTKTLGAGSKVLALLDIEVPSIGSKGNNLGYRIFSPSNNDLRAPLNRRIFNGMDFYPFMFSQITRPDEHSSERVHNTIEGYGDQLLCLKPNGIHPLTNNSMYLNPLMYSKCQDLSDTNSLGVPSHGTIGRVHVYQDNIDLLLALFAKAELDVPNQTHVNDFNINGSVADNMYMFNLFGGHDSNGQPYDSYAIAPSSIHFTPDMCIWAVGGGDGTMNNEVFNELVREEADKYYDWHEPQTFNPFVHPENFIIDTGFDMDTKEALCKFISRRKDTLVLLTGHIHEWEMSVEEMDSICKCCFMMLRIYPESTTFSTPTVRGAVIPGRGYDITQTRLGFDRMEPLVYDIAHKLAMYCGGRSGDWDQRYAMDIYPNNVIRNYERIDCIGMSVDARLNSWDQGITYPVHSGAKEILWPGYRTVYNNPTSTLVSLLTAMVCADCTRIGNLVVARLSGRQGLSRAGFQDLITKTANDLLGSRYGPKADVRARGVIDDFDEELGYTFQVHFDVYTYGGRYAGEIIVNNHRQSDLDG